MLHVYATEDSQKRPVYDSELLCVGGFNFNLALCSALGGLT